MIHRKWSLLTGPVAILGGIVGSVVVANFRFVQNAVGANGVEHTIVSGSMEVLRPCWAVATSGVPVREQLFNVVRQCLRDGLRQVK